MIKFYISIFVVLAGFSFLFCVYLCNVPSSTFNEHLRISISMRERCLLYRSVCISKLASSFYLIHLTKGAKNGTKAFLKINIECVIMMLDLSIRFHLITFIYWKGDASHFTWKIFNWLYGRWCRMELILDGVIFCSSPKKKCQCTLPPGKWMIYRSVEHGTKRPKQLTCLPV